MDIAPAPHELLELADQLTLDVESTGAWSAWHPLSIGAALRLFPKPGSNFGLVVLAQGVGMDGVRSSSWAEIEDSRVCAGYERRSRGAVTPSAEEPI